jgi:hypothetical protein
MITDIIIGAKFGRAEVADKLDVNLLNVVDDPLLFGSGEGTQRALKLSGLFILFDIFSRICRSALKLLLPFHGFAAPPDVLVDDPPRHKLLAAVGTLKFFLGVSCPDVPRKVLLAVGLVAAQVAALDHDLSSFISKAVIVGLARRVLRVIICRLHFFVVLNTVVVVVTVTFVVLVLVELNFFSPLQKLGKVSQIARLWEPF